jgi:ribose-phosphate pyrophosphokinase
VSLTLPPQAEVRGRRVALVDDICSTGATLTGAIRKLRAARVASIEVLVVHALFKPSVGAALRRAGARSVISTDSCSHPSNAIHLAPLLASALTEELVT